MEHDSAIRSSLDRALEDDFGRVWRVGYHWIQHVHRDPDPHVFRRQSGILRQRPFAHVDAKHGSSRADVLRPRSCSRRIRSIRSGGQEIRRPRSPHPSRPPTAPHTSGLASHAFLTDRMAPASAGATLCDARGSTSATRIGVLHAGAATTSTDANDASTNAFRLRRTHPGLQCQLLWHVNDRGRGCVRAGLQEAKGQASHCWNASQAWSTTET